MTPNAKAVNVNQKLLSIQFVHVNAEHTLLWFHSPLVLQYQIWLITPIDSTTSNTAILISNIVSNGWNDEIHKKSDQKNMESPFSIREYIRPPRGPIWTRPLFHYRD